MAGVHVRRQTLYIVIVAGAFAAGCLPGLSGLLGGGPLCGVRTVASKPAPGFLEVRVAFRHQIDPPDSPLARVILGPEVCTTGPMLAGNTRWLYEIGEDGQITAFLTLADLGSEGGKIYTRTPRDGRIELTGGCLSVEFTDSGDGGDDGESLCGPGQMAVDRDGPVTSGPAGGFVCVKAEVSATCLDCGQSDGNWVQKTTTAGAYVASGNLDQVSVADWADACGQPNEPVALHDGDFFDFTTAVTVTYASSPSPEELGYQLREAGQ